MDTNLHLNKFIILIYTDKAHLENPLPGLINSQTLLELALDQNRQ